jgi:hypothetical protein
MAPRGAAGRPARVRRLRRARPPSPPAAGRGAAQRARRPWTPWITQGVCRAALVDHGHRASRAGHADARAGRGGGEPRLVARHLSRSMRRSASISSRRPRSRAGPASAGSRARRGRSSSPATRARPGRSRRSSRRGSRRDTGSCSSPRAHRPTGGASCRSSRRSSAPSSRLISPDVLSVQPVTVDLCRARGRGSALLRLVGRDGLRRASSQGAGRAAPGIGDGGLSSADRRGRGRRSQGARRCRRGRRTVGLS